MEAELLRSQPQSCASVPWRPLAQLHASAVRSRRRVCLARFGTARAWLTRLRMRDAAAFQGRGVSLARRCCIATRRAGAQWSALRTCRVTCAAGAGGPSRSVDVEPPSVAPPAPRAARPAPRAPRPALTRQHASATNAQPTRQQLQLNKSLGTCESADALLDLVASRSAVMNAVNATTALMRLQRCAGKRAAWLQSDPRFAQLLSVAARSLELMEPRNLANALYACGQLSITPPADWLERFWRAGALKLEVQCCSEEKGCCGCSPASHTPVVPGVHCC